MNLMYEQLDFPVRSKRKTTRQRMSQLQKLKFEPMTSAMQLVEGYTHRTLPLCRFDLIWQPIDMRYTNIDGFYK